VLGLQSTALAQTGAASITGLVTDQSGAAAPGVAVTARNQATNVEYSAVSNEAGVYTIPSVTVGNYVVKTTLSGFKTATTRPITLEAKQIARIDFKLEIGALEDAVEVTAQAPVLQTESATVGEVISGNTVQSLPFNGRNVGQLALLLPGTVTYNPRGFTNIGSVNMNRPFVNGNREQTNNFTVDGLDVNETIDNRVAYQPSPDALAEISVETNNYAADVGNVGGALISNVIKSGANQFRGNVFEFYRNSDFDANTWENNRSGAPRQERKQHIFGGTLGGPLIKDKLFFFADYQGSRQDAPGSATASVAPEAWRRGDLSSISTVIHDPLTGLPFPGNQIPLSRISPTALAILNDTANYPLPNRDVAGVAGNYVGETLFKVRAHQGDLRLDWSASANDKLFARFSFATYTDQRDKQSFPLVFATRNDQPFYNVGFNWSRVFGPSVINEVLVGYSHTTVTAETYDWAGVGAANGRYGIAGGQPIDGLSCFTSGTAGSCLGLNGLTPLGAVATDSDTLAKTYQINEKLTWLKGRHALKLGGQLLRYDQRRFYAGNNGLLGYISFNGSFTGSQFADFLLDQVSGKGRGGGDPGDPWTHLQNRIALFVQDDFKVTPTLTLNVGLRWAYTSPLVEKDNRQSNFNLQTGQQTLASDADRALYEPYYKGFEPRVGFAWSASDRLCSAAGTGSPSSWKAPAPTLGSRSTRRSSSSPRSLTIARPVRAGPAPASPSSCQGRLRRATSGPTTPTSARSSPSSGTRSRNTGSARACRPSWATSDTMGPTWSRRPRATRRCPAWATPRPGHRRTRAGRSSERSRSSPRSRRRRRARAASTTRCRRASVSARGTAWSSWPPTPSRKEPPTTAGSTASSAAPVPRA